MNKSSFDDIIYTPYRDSGVELCHLHGDNLRIVDWRANLVFSYLGGALQARPLYLGSDENPDGPDSAAFRAPARIGPASKSKSFISDEVMVEKLLEFSLNQSEITYFHRFVDLKTRLVTYVLRQNKDTLGTWGTELSASQLATLVAAYAYK